jgi:hypothetical protein
MVATNQVFQLRTAAAITRIASSSGTMMGGTIHSARRNCPKGMLLRFAAGARGPQSPVDTVGNAVMADPTLMFQQ